MWYNEGYDTIIHTKERFTTSLYNNAGSKPFVTELFGNRKVYTIVTEKKEQQVTQVIYLHRKSLKTEF